MEKTHSQNHHIQLGRIAIVKQLISEMKSDPLFHDFIYNCLMSHETGECKTVRESQNQIVRSTHLYEKSLKKIGIMTEQKKLITTVFLEK
ncbi:MAG: hypothetical protein ACJATI_004060 [Halioglobus sp.]|jgi:hypothetical protein